MFLSIIIQCILINFVNSHSDHPILIVVSYDGFRYDYLKKDLTPSMLKLRQEGTYSDYMYNVFPSKTFPNHFTIATGMYSEEHGVLGNNFYDPEMKRIVKLETAMFTQNKNVLPIWTLNELSGYTRFSGCMMWPGAKYQFHNTTPTYFELWDKGYDLYKRIDTAISWITNPVQPANLVMIYIEQPDYQSHIYGPDSTVVHDMLGLIDNVTQYLHNHLKKVNLAHKANVVHLGDHGMIGVKFQNIINITKYLVPNTYKLADSSPTLHVIPNKDQENDVYMRLKKGSIENGHFSVYRRNEMPNRWHFKKNIRAPPIFLLAEKGYAFQDLAENVKKYQAANDIKVTPNTMFGMHGYDTNMKEMYSFFMIRGPKVKKNHRINPFSSVDLYSLFAEVLEIDSPRPRSGDLIQSILVKHSSGFSVWQTILITVGGVVLALSLISCAAAVTVVLIKRQQNMTTTAALNKRFPQSFHQTVEAQHLLEAEEA